MIDTHAHLDALEDAEAAVARARGAGVTRIISIGTDPTSWANTLDLIGEAHEDVYGVVGLHPHEATLRSISRLYRGSSRHPKVVGLGEIGLDYYRDYAPRDAAGEALHLPARPRAGGAVARRDPQPRGGRGHGAPSSGSGSTGRWCLHCFSSVALLDEAV